MVCLGLAVGVLPNAGCVYLRLLEFQSQLRDFDRHFELSDKDGLTITMNKPVLFSGDILWLTKRVPTARDETDRSKRWTYLFEKQYPPGQSKPGDFDLTIEMRYRNDKFTEIRFSKQFLAIIPRDFLVCAFQSLGLADIDTQKRIVTSKIKAAGGKGHVWPARWDVVRLLGRPFSVKTQPDRSILTYRYVLKPPAGSSDKKIHPTWCQLTFRRPDQRLSVVDARLFRMNFRMTIPPNAAQTRPATGPARKSP